MDLKATIRTVVDFPVAGVRFRDITTLLQNPAAIRHVVDRLYQRYQNSELHGIAAIDSRGFIFAAPLAYLMGLPLIPIRKPGKLPANPISSKISTEYSEDSLEIHRDALRASDRILIIDDLVATGGTFQAAIELITEIGGTVLECAVVIELVDLGARQRLGRTNLFSLVEFRESEIDESYRPV